MQREFRKVVAAVSVLLAAAILLAAKFIRDLPDREELGRRDAQVRFEPVRLGGTRAGPFHIAGAWRVQVDDPRFGGISAMAIAGGQFVAISDSGVVARFPKPGTPAATMVLDELPDGPGKAGFKYNRDSEAVAADPAGRGWWVAFENRNALWLFDPSFESVLARHEIAAAGLGRNRGIEAMAFSGRRLLLFSERGEGVLPWRGEVRPIRGLGRWISDAVRLPNGRLLVAARSPTPIGLANVLVALTSSEAGYSAGPAWPIPVGRLDNVEALAIEPRPDGGFRLWMMTDNNLQQRQPTLLIALELRPRPARQPSSKSRA